ncbi:acetate/propionate family kinase [Myxosarcina sp. GI1]|uniref:acetate/propionate family kinase n=1 Tax=Myxosarcina sp. GI1 TaxID=1541065 RepID=UPI0005697300|nr:acetate kinase [Myxosarcina sp. GI1]
MYILVLNAGSSSQKSCLYQLEELPPQPPEPLWEAHIDWTVAANFGSLTVKSNGIKQQLELANRDNAIKKMLYTLVRGETKVLDKLEQIELVGHRVVHGGAKYSQPTIITPQVKTAIAELIPLAPNHNPAHLEGIDAIEKILPDATQVAVIDTAFHSQIPQAAKVYPLPYEWYERGIQRYGFHGTSHQYCATKTAQILDKPLDSLKIITCHLGNGCSLAAIKDGICIDTTMGFSPLEGLMMGTRCGSIDPQILLYLMREYDLDRDELNRLLNKESGLLGVSGISADMRTILTASAEGKERAQLAFDIYIHRLSSSIGAMMASLEGMDALVFTAGVGENAVAVREKTCDKFAFLGLQLDLDKNNARPVNEDIATPDSQVRVLVVHTEEDWAIASQCWQLQLS